MFQFHDIFVKLTLEYTFALEYTLISLRILTNITLIVPYGSQVLLYFNVTFTIGCERSETKAFGPIYCSRPETFSTMPLFF